MAKTDYTFGHAKARKKKRLVTFSAAQSSTAGLGMRMKLYKRYKDAKKDIENIKLRRRSIQMCSFNLNRYSDHMALHDFRFRVKDLPKIANLLYLPNGTTKRKRYFCDNMKSLDEVRIHIKSEPFPVCGFF